ncbi:MAG: hypothetical protein IID30_01695 [Planctomycetes bacterium]|nr:hypothetical protein [Planctomycetota bacterium]
MRGGNERQKGNASEDTNERQDPDPPVRGHVHRFVTGALTMPEQRLVDEQADRRHSRQ